MSLSQEDKDWISERLEQLEKTWRAMAQKKPPAQAGMAEKKNKAAVEMARLRNKKLSSEEKKAIASLGGLKGGTARAESLTPARRKAIAQKAAAARWGTKKPAAKKAVTKAAKKARVGAKNTSLRKGHTPR